MKVVKVTELEAKLLEKIAKGLYAEYNFSDIELEDISDDVNRDRGVLSSLIKKEIVCIWENRKKYGDPSDFDVLMICDDAIEAVRAFTKINFWDDYEGESTMMIEA